jgi:hypothetical protein
MSGGMGENNNTFTFVNVGITILIMVPPSLQLFFQQILPPGSENEPATAAQFFTLFPVC